MHADGAARPPLRTANAGQFTAGLRGLAEGTGVHAGTGFAPGGHLVRQP